MQNFSRNIKGNIYIAEHNFDITEWSASCFLRSVDGPRSRSGWSGEDEYLGSLPYIETGHPPPGKLLFRRNYPYSYSGVKNIYVHIEYNLIYGMFMDFIAVELYVTSYFFHFAQQWKTKAEIFQR